MFLKMPVCYNKNAAKSYGGSQGNGNLNVYL